jgi:hypothetical protein
MLFPMVVFAVISAGLVFLGLQKSSPPQHKNGSQMKLFRK